MVVLALGLAVGLAIAQPLPALAADNHPLLTLDLLRQRLAAPVQREGRPAIDLRYYTIDLRPDSPLTDSFYRLLSSGSAKTGHDPDPRPELRLGAGRSRPAAPGPAGNPSTATTFHRC
jgi:hypothetical protein